MSHDRNNKIGFSWVFPFLLNPNVLHMCREITNFKTATNPHVTLLFHQYHILRRVLSVVLRYKFHGFFHFCDFLLVDFDITLPQLPVSSHFLSIALHLWYYTQTFLTSHLLYFVLMTIGLLSLLSLIWYFKDIGWRQVQKPLEFEAILDHALLLQGGVVNLGSFSE